MAEYQIPQRASLRVRGQQQVEHLLKSCCLPHPQGSGVSQTGPAAIGGPGNAPAPTMVCPTSWQAHVQLGQPQTGPLVKIGGMRLLGHLFLLLSLQPSTAWENENVLSMYCKVLDQDGYP